MPHNARSAILVLSLSALVGGFGSTAQAEPTTLAFPPMPAEEKPSAHAAASATPAPATPAPATPAPAPTRPEATPLTNGPTPSLQNSASFRPTAPASVAPYPPEPRPPALSFQDREGVPSPPHEPNAGFKLPDISVRADPLTLLLEGRLGLELEVALTRLVSLEVVPVFVTSKSPPLLNYSSFDSTLSQSSNGIGPMSGAAIDAGFWFAGKPFRGNVLRVGVSNYAYTFESRDDFGPIDAVDYTEREAFVLFGQHNRWDAFTLAFAFGLGYQLSQEDRCFSDGGAPVSNCPKRQRLIRVDRDGSVGNLDSFVYPFDLLARISLGLVF